MKVKCIRCECQVWYSDIHPFNEIEGPEVGEVCTVTGEIMDCYLLEEYPNTLEGYYKECFVPLSDLSIDELFERLESKDYIPTKKECMETLV